MKLKDWWLKPRKRRFKVPVKVLSDTVFKVEPQIKKTLVNEMRVKGHTGKIWYGSDMNPLVKYLGLPIICDLLTANSNQSQLNLWLTCGGFQMYFTR